MELRFKAARSTVDIDLTLQRSIVTSSATDDTNQIVRKMLQSAAGIELGDWFEYLVGPPIMDLTAAPYGGARYPIEVQMNARVFSQFHLDADIGDIVMQPLEIVTCRDGHTLLEAYRSLRAALPTGEIASRAISPTSPIWPNRTLLLFRFYFNRVN